MGLKKAENQVKILLAETILSMCRNTLNYHAEICVEGLLGITLDNEEIFLVNINQTIKNQVDTPGRPTSSKENLKRIRKDNVGSESEPESSSNESDESASGTKKRRKRVRRKKHKGEKNGSESENVEEEYESTTIAVNIDPTNLQSDDIIEKKFSLIREQTDGSDQYYDNSNQTLGNDSFTEDGTPSGVHVTVKQEPSGEGESDDDLVFVKQEVDDYNMSQPSTHQFSNLSQMFQSSADMSLSQPSDLMSGAFFSSSANNMSSTSLQQPVPGPSASGSTPGRKQTPRRIKCEICGVILKGDRHDLKRHIFTHTGQKPYKCRLCGHGHIQKGGLKAHWMRKHPEVPWDVTTSCIECPLK